MGFPLTIMLNIMLRRLQYKDIKGLTNKMAEIEEAHEGGFECNICLDTVQNAVVSFCGHLFCWSCLSKWLDNKSRVCPSCKATISKDKVIPLYGRGGSKPDSSDNFPPRPPAQRTEPESNKGLTFSEFGISDSDSFGIGSSTLGLFVSTLDLAFRTSENEEEPVSTLFLCLILIYSLSHIIKTVSTVFSI